MHEPSEWKNTSVTRAESEVKEISFGKWKKKTDGKTLKIANLKIKKQNKNKRVFTANENERKTAKMVSLRTARYPINQAAARPLTSDRDAELLAPYSRNTTEISTCDKAEKMTKT